MPPVPDDAFRELLADCSPSAFAAVVADLWRARGHDVRRDGDRLHVDDGELRAVVALDPDSLPDDLVLVSATEPPASVDADQSVVGPADLHRMLLYGLPRERAAELFEAHFDRPLDDDWSDLAPDASAPAPDDTETAAGVTGSRPDATGSGPDATGSGPDATGPPADTARPPPDDDREAGSDDIGVADPDDEDATESDPSDGTDPEAPDESPTRPGGGWRGRRLGTAATWLPRSRGDVRALVGDRRVQVAVVAALAVLAAAGWGLAIHQPGPETQTSPPFDLRDAPPPVDGSYRAVGRVDTIEGERRSSITRSKTYAPGDPAVAVSTSVLSFGTGDGDLEHRRRVVYERGRTAYGRLTWTNETEYRRAVDRRDPVRTDEATLSLYSVRERIGGADAEPFGALPGGALRILPYERDGTATVEGRRAVRYVPTAGWTAVNPGFEDDHQSIRVRAASGEVLVDADTGAVLAADVEATLVWAETWGEVWSAVLTGSTQDVRIRYGFEPDVERPEAPPWVEGLDEEETTPENASAG